MERAKGQRMALLGDRVDCNAIRRKNRIEETIGAFGAGKGHLMRDMKPSRLLSPKSQARVDALKQQG